MVLRELGRGGMGAVYEAQERLSRRGVALKVMHGNIAASPRGRALFLGEMGILANVDHPNVVRLLACLEDRGQLVMVLELLRGETLGRTLKRFGRLAWTDAVVITRGILSGLAAAHGQQPPVVHRDLKPANVMLTEEGIVKVMDFGIAKIVEGETSGTADVGTLQYMPPEQIDGGAIDARADLYATGLVLYEMLAGAPPFRSNSTRELLQAQCTAPVPPLPSEVANAVPQDLVAIMLLLLAKAPAERPGSAAAALRMLESLGGADTLSFRPTTPPHPPDVAQGAAGGSSAGYPSEPAPAGSFPGASSQWQNTIGPAALTGGVPTGSTPGGSQWQDTRGPAAPTGGMPAGSFPGGSQWGASQPGTHGGHPTGAGYPAGGHLSPPPAPAGSSFGPAHSIAAPKPRRMWPWIAGGMVVLLVGVSAAAMSQFGTTKDQPKDEANGQEFVGSVNFKASEGSVVFKASDEQSARAQQSPPTVVTPLKQAPVVKVEKANEASAAEPKPKADPEPGVELGVLQDDGAALQLVDPPSRLASGPPGSVTVLDTQQTADTIAQTCPAGKRYFRNRFGSVPVSAASPTRIDGDTVEDIVFRLGVTRDTGASLLAISGRTFEPIWHAKDLPDGEVTRVGQLLLYAAGRELRGIDVRSGNQRWAATLTDGVAQLGMGRDSEDLFVLTIDEKLHRVNPQDGTISGAPTTVHPRTLGPIPKETPRLEFRQKPGPDLEAPRISDLTNGKTRCAEPGVATSQHRQRCLGDAEAYGSYESFPGTGQPFAVGLRNGEELWRTQLFDVQKRAGGRIGDSLAIGGPFFAIIKYRQLAVVSRLDGVARWPAPVDLGDVKALELLVSAERVYVIYHCPLVIDAEDATLLSPWGR
ncbi:MAG: protein kinase [Nannocystaceae bacterium]|nr:protein kinase [Nannocystaceae bacterium]